MVRGLPYCPDRQQRVDTQAFYYSLAAGVFLMLTKSMAGIGPAGQVRGCQEFRLFQTS